MNYYRTPRSTTKCGKSATGQSCSLGPIGGRCGLQGLGADQVPCKPIRTLHWWNNVLRLAFALLALIVASFAWGSFSTRRIATPGPLSVAHAQLLVSKRGGAEIALAIDANNRCSACHPGLENRGMQGLQENAIQGTVSQGTASQSQSQLCLHCHLEAMPDAQFGSPHDLTGSALKQLVERNDRGANNGFFSFLVGHRPNAWESTSTECSQCHREHQGAAHDLKKISSERCQSCHQNAFASFSNGHPEFKDYPSGASREIAFDHKRHQDLHYTKKGASFDCKVCHIQTDQVGVVGKVFRSLPFETACASCHSEPIRSAAQDGLIVLQLPSVNRKQLSDAGFDIGIWPEQASQMNDGTIPIPMRWLLQAEPNGENLFASLPPSGRLSEMDMNDPQQRQALANLVQATKALMIKLANQGQPGFRESIAGLIHGPVEPGAQGWLNEFASGLPPDLFRAAMSEWLMPSGGSGQAVQGPKSASSESVSSETAKVWLSSQIQSPDDDLLLGQPLNSADAAGGLLTDDSLLSNPPTSLEGGLGSESVFRDSKAWDQLTYGGWMIDRQRMAIVYVPKGHADSWFSKWIELETVQQASQSGSVSQELVTLGSLSQQCKTCHLLSSARAEPNIIFEGSSCWRSERRAANLSPISKFDHTPHLALPAINDCRSCHQLAETGNPAGEGFSAEAVGGRHGLREFVPMQKNQCSSCHTANAAGESCTQCHNYHVGNASWR